MKMILKIIGVICAFIFFLIFNFWYDLMPSFLTSIFSLVNDSLFEYSKVVFGSVLFAGVVQKIIVILSKKKINNICFSNFTAAFLSIPIFCLLSTMMFCIFEKNDIVISFVLAFTIAAVEIISYILMNKKDFKMENKTIFLAITVYLIFNICKFI